MQSSPYNNPMFAQGLSGLIQGFIGNPGDTAKNEMLASQALLNNQTAQYRDAIGDTGLSGDLASMMIRALQAGSQYSGNAPEIGDAALRMGAMGFGSPELTPQGPIAQMIMQAMSRGGRSGGRRSSGGSPGKLTEGAQNRVARMVRDAGYKGAEAAQVMTLILEEYAAGGLPTLDQAAGSILPNVEYEEVVVGTDPNDSWYNPADWFRGPSDITEQRLGVLTQKTPAQIKQSDLEVSQVINQAREAIASGKDPRAVRARLVEMGIDSSNL